MSAKTGRNQPCPCGSGKKFKKCCLGSTGSAPRPDELEEMLAAMAASRGSVSEDQEAEFAQARAELEAIFASYHAEDVILMLGVSDLWLPNIASQVKHHLALAVFAAMAPDRFDTTSRIADYTTFCDVLGRVHALLPHFASLEDYVPEPDWGEVKLSWQGELLRVFYGSVLERVPDFVEGFRLANAENEPALADVGVALQLQDRILSTIDRAVAGDPIAAEPGHVELPSEAFWLACSHALRKVAHDFPAAAALSPDLSVGQGTLPAPDTAAAFGDAIFSGVALPALFLRVGEGAYPVVPRNAIVNVLDRWGRRPRAASVAWYRCLAVQLSGFLERRIDYRKFAAGPLLVHGTGKPLPTPFAGLLTSDRTFYFVVGLDRRDLTRLPKIEEDLLALAGSGEPWGIRQDGARHSVQFRDGAGRLPGPDQIVVLAVVPHETSEMGHISSPPTQAARLISMSDFVSIFDTISDLAELDRYWAYVETNGTMIQSGLLGLTDIFAAFRQSEGVLVAGAVQPNMIMLDPHGGSNWRYEVLAEFWRDAPALFPDDDPSGWTVEPVDDRIHPIVSKSEPVQSWSAIVGGCVIHILYRVDPGMEDVDARILGLVAHCMTDALAQRREMLTDAALFRRRRLTVQLYPSVAAESGEDGVRDRPLVARWDPIEGRDPARVTAHAFVNLARALACFTDPPDSAFEVECAIAFVTGLSDMLGDALDGGLAERLAPTAAGKPRFTLVRSRRTVDAPDVVHPQLPRAEHYKLARRDIAVILRDNGAAPGRYELAAAKALIDPARDAFRDLLHARLARLNKPMVLLYCIDQHDALSADYQRTRARVRHSLTHEVTYDRAQALAEAYDTYTRESRNYRYLLECCLSIAPTDDLPADEEEILQLLAHVNWLFVLSGASDVLHNDVAVAGLAIDDMYVPEVFYSEEGRERQDAFGREQAGFGLGLKLGGDVEMLPADGAEARRARIDAAFLSDAGFTFTHLLDALSVLTQWQSFQGREDLHLSYRAAPGEIARVVASVVDGLEQDEAERIVAFLTLQPDQIRRLLGKDVDEGDVPVWDHNKRGSRYAIRPLVPLGDLLAWGAATAERSHSIWLGNIAGGYLPADFAWPRVQSVMRAVKGDIDKRLERQAFDIFGRHTDLVMPGIDFRRRFPQAGFDDVGDFDVLAYWPDQNRWVAVECKYNQPPFCLKDARRLRERIFGIAPDRGQFTKVERRSVFLAAHLERIRELLGWPASTGEEALAIADLYVSRDIYWWMRNPPYEVAAEFVRIDGLAGWLAENGYGELLD